MLSPYPRTEAYKPPERVICYTDAVATINLPDELAERVAPFGYWLPTVLEVGLLKLKTPAAETASELSAFLWTNPSAQEVQAYHASQRSQTRVSQLLALNQAGVIGEAEAEELDKLLKLEHVIIMLKTQLTSGGTATA